ncbi:hypothetical protein QAD02_006678 [Eretmocerus hayati]|uniref:Uncharacterized protein n=1 Tax=Eretmocerus hayati TaxID=131215 RepID=A0ACC2N1X2_9HYME|nr:hypothetical protein QAD02_006678 [Eretmocerus hayati]
MSIPPLKKAKFIGTTNSDNLTDQFFEPGKELKRKPRSLLCNPMMSRYRKLEHWFKPKTISPKHNLRKELRVVLVRCKIPVTMSTVATKQMQDNEACYVPDLYMMPPSTSHGISEAQKRSQIEDMRLSTAATGIEDPVKFEEYKPFQGHLGGPHPHQSRGESSEMFEPQSIDSEVQTELWKCNENEVSKHLADTLTLMRQAESELTIDFEATMDGSCLKKEQTDQKFDIVNSIPARSPSDYKHQQQQLKNHAASISVNLDIDLTQRPKSQRCITNQSGIRTRSGRTYYIETSDEDVHNAQRKASSDRVKSKCDICGMKFSQKRQILKHIVQHLNGKQFCSCDICNKVFKRKSDLADHLKRCMNHSIHQSNKPSAFFCDICGANFATKSKLRFHIKEHMEMNPFRCKVCNKGFMPYMALEQHIMIAHTNRKPSGIGEKVVCSTGNIKIEATNDLHEINSTKISQTSSLKGHLKCHSDVRLSFTCDRCDKRYDSKSQLRNHIMMMHRSSGFTCKICGKILGSKKNLRNHIKTHERKKLYSCRNCDKKFLYASHLQFHAKTHQDQREFSCDICDKRLRLKKSLVAHALVHTDRGSYVCKICNLKFKNKSRLKEHIRELHEDGNPMTCDSCGNIYKRKESLIAHITKEHGSGSSLCDICGKVCLNGRVLKEHLRIHTDPSKKPRSCKICNKILSSKRALQGHMVQHESSRILFPCKICGKSLKTESTLQIHLNLHMGENKFLCKVCDKSLATKGGFRRHMMKHTGTEPYSCNVCGKRYAGKIDFENHVRSHSGEKPFACEVCGKQFARKKVKDFHEKSHRKWIECKICRREFKTEQSLVKHKLKCRKEDRLACEFCNKTYSSRVTMWRHKLTHTRGKTIECDSCGRLFYTKKELIGHMMKHTGERRRYLCKICGKTFHSKLRLTTHIKNDHEDKQFVTCGICQKGFSTKNILEVHIRIRHDENIDEAEENKSDLDIRRKNGAQLNKKSKLSVEAAVADSSDIYCEDMFSNDDCPSVRTAGIKSNDDAHICMSARRAQKTEENLAMDHTNCLML